ncbi:MAG: VWA domain-containing protein [Pirellulales bacterium]|nr:VWA domain-containing protein [Pirellulales bacterium]
MSRALARWTAVLLFLVPAVARAQGLLVVVDPHQQARLPRPVVIHHYHPPIPHPPPPTPPTSYKIQELDVHARLIDQVAQVQVSQSFVNTGSRQMEVAFVFPLPYDGAIEQMTLLVDGKEYPAKLLDAKDARQMYEEIVRKNRDPALLEWMGTGLFKTSVFPVPPGAKRTVSLRYSQMCRKQEGLTDFLFPLSTAKYTSDAVEKVNIRATIESQIDIKNVYSPSHAVEIKRPDDRHATVTFTCKNEVPSTDFRLLYDVGKGKVSTRVLSYRPDRGRDGFFLLLASPKIKAPDEKRPKKTVVFVVDRSGSMSGKKIEQARGALQYVLNNLREGDLFNIVAYDSQVESFRPELQRFDEKTRKDALGFVEGIYAGGSTNIDGALRAALGQLQDSSRPNYVLFLTDGLPTAGETNEMKIVANAGESNKVHARIFSFGVGYDVNSRLLDKLVRANFGQGEFVRPDEDIEDRVSRLYRRIESPVLTGVEITFELDELRSEEGKPINRVYPSGSFDLFAGEQLVVVGRYKKAGTAKVIVRGTIGDEKQKFDFPAKLVNKSDDETHAFIQKLWAIRRVGEILDELDLKGKNDELITELVTLSKRHGILTPYTSFMADENAGVHDLAGDTRRAEVRLRELGQTDGADAFGQRLAKQMYLNADRAAMVPAEPLMEAAKAAAPGLGTYAGRSPGSGRSRSGGVSGYGFEGSSTPVTGPAARGSIVAEAGQEAQVAIRTVRNLGNRTFYLRNGRWVDSLVTEQQEAKARRVKQFSDAYFELAETHGKKMSQYMVFDEPVLLSLGSQAYLIEP